MTRPGLAHHNPVEALMQHRSYPSRPGTPTPPASFALHLVHGVWVASCPDCGHELGRSRDQETAERAGERRRCPICRPDRPDRQARLTFLVAWLGANGLDHQGVDHQQEAS